MLEDTGIAPFASELSESTAELRSAVTASFDTVVSQIDIDGEEYVSELENIVASAIIGNDNWEEELGSLRDKFLADMASETGQAILSDEGLESLGDVGDALTSLDLPTPSDYIDSAYLERFESSVETLSKSLQHIAGRTVEGLVDNVRNFLLDFIPTSLQ